MELIVIAAAGAALSALCVTVRRAVTSRLAVSCEGCDLSPVPLRPSQACPRSCPGVCRR